jgi:two-component sensor histidine kinase
LGAYCEGDAHRIILDGPHLVLETDSAQTLAVAIHELATNAAKYGALSIPQGNVRVEWSEPVKGRISVRWTESNGPEVKPPSKTGFGTTVMQRLIAGREGDLKFDWKSEGLRCQVTMAT